MSKGIGGVKGCERRGMGFDGGGVEPAWIGHVMAEMCVL